MFLIERSNNQHHIFTKLFFLHFLSPGAGGTIRTLDLMIMGRLVDHCATGALKF
jgi:hypothetical protein